MTVVQLPDDEGALLRRLRETDRRLFLARVHALVEDGGWPLRAVGEPLGTGRSTVRAWKVAAEGDKTSDEPDALPPVPVRTRVKVVRMRPDVPEEEQEHLLRLAQQARNVNRWTPAGAPERLASQELNRLLHMYVRRGVPVRTLANRLGVTYRAVVARLERQEKQQSESVAV